MKTTISRDFNLIIFYRKNYIGIFKKGETASGAPWDFQRCKYPYTTLEITDSLGPIKRAGHLLTVCQKNVVQYVAYCQCVSTKCSHKNKTESNPKAGSF